MEAPGNNQGRKLKFVLFLFSTMASILLIGVIGQLPNGYVDADGIEAWFQLHFKNVLLVIFLIDIVLAYLCFRIVSKLVTETFEWVLTVALSGILYYLFMFLTCKSAIAIINRNGNRSTVEIHGVVMNKLIRLNQKKTNHAYYVTVTDTLASRNYYFNVSDYVFKRTNRGEVFNKTFFKGSLGIIYRKEEE